MRACAARSRDMAGLRLSFEDKDKHRGLYLLSQSRSRRTCFPAMVILIQENRSEMCAEVSSQQREVFMQDVGASQVVLSQTSPAQSPHVGDASDFFECFRGLRSTNMTGTPLPLEQKSGHGAKITVF
jgi:hypothetical protein